MPVTEQRRPPRPAGPAQSPHVQLRLGPLERLSVSVTVAPHVSVLSLLTDTFRGRVEGTPRSFVSTVRAARSAIAPGPIRPMVEPGYSVAPDVVVPIPPSEDVSATAHLDYLRSAPGEAVVDDLVHTFGPEPPGHWRRVADHPTRWLRGYADAASVVWERVEPLWRRADPLLRREIDRVAVAAARRQHEVMLSGLGGKITYSDGSLFLPDSEPETYDLDGRPLVLVPMLSGPRSVIANFDRPDIVWIAYPLPGQGRLDTLPAAEPGRDAVETILGRHRAAILRLLDVSAHMSAMAERLHYTPSTLTHHCDRLFEAGLITRERRGRQMVVSRTDRGTALLDLLGGD